MKSNRPAGVTIFGVLLILFSISALIQDILAVIISFLIGTVYDVGIYNILAVIILLVEGIMGLVGGIGILKLKSWAIKLVTILAIVAITFAVLDTIITNPELDTSTITFAIIGILFYAVLLWYLNQKNVKSIFSASPD